IFTSAPVRGLRPVEALRCATWKLPKPTIRTVSPPCKALSMFLNIASTAFSAESFDRSDSFATWATSSALFTGHHPFAQAPVGRGIRPGGPWGTLRFTNKSCMTGAKNAENQQKWSDSNLRAGPLKWGKSTAKTAVFRHLACGLMRRDAG